MASTAAHRSTGWAAGVIAAAMVSPKIADPYYVWTIMTCFAGFAGGTAPDWLEHAWWSRAPGRPLWIAHRSWTHWGLAWLVLFALAYMNLGTVSIAAPVLGFAAGGVMHLLADWPNPLGVPWLLTKRYSLAWWNSGRCDYLIIALAWVVAIALADTTWWHSVLHARVGAALQEIAAFVPSSHVRFLARWLYPFA